MVLKGAFENIFRLQKLKIESQIPRASLAHNKYTSLTPLPLFRFPPCSVWGRWGNSWPSAGLTIPHPDWQPCAWRKHSPRCQSPRTLNSDIRGAKWRKKKKRKRKHHGESQLFLSVGGVENVPEASTVQASNSPASQGAQCHHSGSSGDKGRSSQKQGPLCLEEAETARVTCVRHGACCFLRKPCILGLPPLFFFFKRCFSFAKI